MTTGLIELTNKIELSLWSFRILFTSRACYYGSLSDLLAVSVLYIVMLSGLARGHIMLATTSMHTLYQVQWYGGTATRVDVTWSEAEPRSYWY